MYRSKTRLIRSAVLLSLSMALLAAATFSGSAALEYTRQAVAFGPRPAGSPANRKLQSYIETQLKPLHCQVTFDPFTAQTPSGLVEMRTIIAKFPGKSGSAIVVSGHFDTKPDIAGFVGANDGGSSTGLLIELARVVNTLPHSSDIVLVWLDGEEAFGEWTELNGTYGSRHLVEKWTAESFLPKIKALINVDMIGDKDLGIVKESSSTATLRQLVWETAAESGYGKYFLDSEQGIEDDHLPFLKRGVKALDLIDFDYGPANAYWHTEKDTMDKLSAHSLEVVGRVLVLVLGKLQ